ncbi:MAG: hypothetical protein QXO37_06880 [Candidatus Nitrosocaldaceae archaeon]
MKSEEKNIPTLRRVIVNRQNNREIFLITLPKHIVEEFELRDTLLSLTFDHDNKSITIKKATVVT